MIDSLEMTVCRVDNLDGVFVGGSRQLGWVGLNGYGRGLGIIGNVSGEVLRHLPQRPMSNNHSYAGMMIRDI